MRQTAHSIWVIADTVISRRTGIGKNPVRAARQRESLFLLRQEFAFRCTGGCRSFQADRNPPELIVWRLELRSIKVVPPLRQRDVGRIPRTLRLHVDDWFSRLLDPRRHNLIDRFVGGLGLSTPEVLGRGIRVL